jgi:signal peptidase I
MGYNKNVFPAKLARAVVNRLFESPLRIVGDSMLPTLTDQQRVRTVSLSLPWNRWNRIGRGDIVVFHHPNDRDRTSIKRIIGLPGEYIQLIDDGVWIDESPLPEPYLSGAPTTTKGKAAKWLLDSDEYFVLGDNRGDSEDSRDFGPLRRPLVVERVSLH